MTIASDEYKSQVGLDSLYIAEVTVDSSAAYTAETPSFLAPAAEASQEPTVNSTMQYADDTAFDTMVSEGETKVTLTITNLPVETLAKISGKRFDSTTGRLYDTSGTPPYCALMFRSKKSNGKYRYYSFLKGRFDVPKEAMKTDGEKSEPQTVQLNYTAIRTTHKFTVASGVTEGVKRVVGDEDTASFSATNWFATVQVPGAASISALALSSSVPVDDATAVDKAGNITLTFNNALQDDAVNSITLLDANNAVVASTVTLDATKKIVTIDPTASLAATTAHAVVYTVEDIYGQHLTGVLTFTTGA